MFCYCLVHSSGAFGIDISRFVQQHIDNKLDTRTQNLQDTLQLKVLKCLRIQNITSS